MQNIAGPLHTHLSFRKMNEKCQPLQDQFDPYFHQDWNIYKSDWRIALSEALLDFRAKDPTQLTANLDELLQAKTDQNLEEMLYPDFHCNHIPSDDEMSARQWFVEIKEILDKTLSQRERDGIGDMTPNYIKQIKNKGSSST